MKYCAFLSMDSLVDFVCYDELLIEPFKNTGWKVEIVSWRDDKVDWNKFDVVIIRSTWDYQDDYEAFLKVLHEIDNSSAILVNNLELVKWNVNKRYLLELKNSGVDIVPTKVYKNFNISELYNAFDTYNCDNIIIKPSVSANADNTFKISKNQLDSMQAYLSKTFIETEHLVQPFIESIVTEGEYSLFYFGCEFSHAILKTPKLNDFRVQEEHGGRLKFVTADKEMLETSERIINSLPSSPLYVRVDLVKSKNKYLLMEVELIEPSLYFNMDSNSAHKFTDAFNDWYKSTMR